MKTNEGSWSGICLFVWLCAVVLCLGLAPPAFARVGLSRIDQETFNQAQSITVLKGDTVWFWVGANYEQPPWIGDIEHLGDLGTATGGPGTRT